MNENKKTIKEILCMNPYEHKVNFLSLSFNLFGHDTKLVTLFTMLHITVLHSCFFSKQHTFKVARPVSYRI
jgi:hypothetical protein